MTDERLRLLFTCCHPALAPEAQVALTLRLLGGLTVPEVAARLPRARAHDGPADHPRQAQDRRRQHPLPRAARPRAARSAARRARRRLPRLHRGPPARAPATDGIRDDLCAEAIRLGRVLRDLMPDEPEVAGLLALMLLTDARRAARVDADGVLVTLDAQDRSLWDRALDRRGPRARAGVPAPQPSRPLPAPRGGQRRAHRRRDRRRHRLVARCSPSTTSWMPCRPTPVVALNRAVALAEVEGPAGGARRRRRARRSTATTRSTRRGPTCCAGSGAARRPRRPTTGRWSSRRTPPSGPSSRVVARRSADRPRRSRPGRARRSPAHRGSP